MTQGVDRALAEEAARASSADRHDLLAHDLEVDGFGQADGLGEPCFGAALVAPRRFDFGM
jgi:hypothetical protein